MGGRLFLHPFDAVVVPATRLLGVPQLPVSHGQEEPIPIETQFRRPIERVDGPRVIGRAIAGDAECVPVLSVLRVELDRSFGQLDGPTRIAQLGIGPS